MNRVIVDYNTMWGQPLATEGANLPAGWTITTDHRYLSEAAAVVFHIPSLGRLPEVAKPPGQVWVAWSMEAEANYPRLANPEFMRRFDLTMTYRLNADIPIPYNCFYGSPADFIQALRQPPRSKSRDRLAALFISSPFNRSGRLDYVKELMDCMEIHSYGRQLQNRTLTPDHGQTSKLETIASYHFTLALENAIGEDYVTEKFFDPLVVGSVPIYLGAPNVAAFAPGEQCFINVADFPTPRALADYLLVLAEDEAAYAAYLTWKNRPLRAEFCRWLDRQTPNLYDRLVEKIQERRGK